jgi:hypothetical protein
MITLTTIYRYTVMLRSVHVLVKETEKRQLVRGHKLNYEMNAQNILQF